MGLVALPEPDQTIMSCRDAIVADLRRLLGADAVIADEDGRRTYETDALTAYRRLPLAVVLPASTEEVSRALAYCHQHGVKVWREVPAPHFREERCLPRRCGDRRLPHEPRARGRLHEPRGPRPGRRHQPRISDAVQARGFFYAPDPSSQLACTLAGNIGMNSGGAHCLKYGVTTNNVLGVKMVLMDGEVIEIGGAHLDAPGLRPHGAGDRSEGQLGHRHGGNRAHPAGRRRCPAMLLGFDTSEAAGQCVSAIIAAALSPWPSNSWTGRRSMSARRSPRPAIPSMSRRC